MARNNVPPELVARFECLRGRRPRGVARGKQRAENRHGDAAGKIEQGARQREREMRA